VREQTPPLLKWLLVERATLAGNTVRTHERARHIDRELARAQEQLALLGREVARLQKHKMWLYQSLAVDAARLAALDKATGIASGEQIAPEAAGMIRAHSGEYGKSGNLKSFIELHDQERTPGIPWEHAET
jgi:hypothetical protein